MQVMDEETKTGLWGSNLSGGYQVPTTGPSFNVCLWNRDQRLCWFNVCDQHLRVSCTCFYERPFEGYLVCGLGAIYVD